MAIMDGKKFDGIQLGKRLDKCCICERALIQDPDREIPYLEYEEVFKVKIGLSNIINIDFKIIIIIITMNIKPKKSSNKKKKEEGDK